MTSRSSRNKGYSQVLLAVSDLHCRGIVHRDLKPENLLFYDNRAGSPLLVVDFGLSDYEEELSSESAVCGTATYLAPEVSNCSDLALERKPPPHGGRMKEERQYQAWCTHFCRELLKN